MKRLHLTLICTFLSLAFTGLMATAQPTQDSLVKAWEQVQKSDSETVVFEKIEDRRYKFKTNRFPFDGELRILNVVIDDRMAEYEAGFILGSIEYDLVGLSEDVEKKYQQSYAMWRQSNVLYFDKASGSWQSSRQFQSSMAAKARELSGSEFGDVRTVSSAVWTSVWGWLPFLLVIAGLIWWTSRISSSQQKAHFARLQVHMDRVEANLDRIAKALEPKPKEEQPPP